MRRFRWGLFLIFLVTANLALAQRAGLSPPAPGVEISEMLLVGLSGRDGRTISRFPLEPDTHALPEVLFKISLPPELEKHRGWTLEVTEPTRKASLRLAVEGAIPAILRWNGVFSDGSRIQPGHRYFMRVLLDVEEKKVASNWSFFSTELRALELQKNAGVSFQIIPSVAAEFAVLQTTNFRIIHLPVMVGDFRLIWKDNNAFALTFETTSNMIFNYRPTATGFFYSDLSFSYHRRFSGAPSKRVDPPFVPPYSTASVSRPSPPNPAELEPGLEAGIRVFSSTLRGFGNQPIDLELARQMGGVAGSVRADRRTGDFRLSALFEVGYTFFRGQILTLSGQGMLSYERFAMVSPGVEFRLHNYSGNAADDAFDGIPDGSVKSVSNQMLFVGANLRFNL